MALQLTPFNAASRNFLTVPQLETEEYVVNNTNRNKCLISKSPKEHMGSKGKIITQVKGDYYPPLKGMDNDTMCIMSNYRPGIVHKMKGIGRGYFNRLLTSPYLTLDLVRNNKSQPLFSWRRVYCTPLAC